jgi:hypothetical protein
MDRNYSTGARVLGNTATTMTISNPQTSAEPMTMLRHAVHRLGSSGGQLSKSIIDIREILDRLIGTQPQDVKNGTAPQAVPNGDIQAVHAEIDSYENMLTLLQVEISRLRAL